MKTSYLALALLSPFAVAAQTPSSTLAPPPATSSAPVTIYGTVDAGLVGEGACASACAHSKLDSGVETGSRLGFSGRESLGDDTSAVFTLEEGIQNDTGKADQNGRLFGRQAFVGLDSAHLGALTLGRQYNLQYQVLVDVADPFKGGLAGTATNLMGYSVMRYDNSIKYVTPSSHGWSAAALYSFGESPNSSATNRAYGASLGYADGPVNVSVAHQRKDNPGDFSSGDTSSTSRPATRWWRPTSRSAWPPPTPRSGATRASAARRGTPAIPTARWCWRRRPTTAATCWPACRCRWARPPSWPRISTRTTAASSTRTPTNWPSA